MREGEGACKARAEQGVRDGGLGSRQERDGLLGCLLQHLLQDLGAHRRETNNACDTQTTRALAMTSKK